MSEPMITCPECQHEFKLTESLAAPLIDKTRHEFERRLAEKDRNVAARETAIRDQQTALAAQSATLDQTIAERVAAERARIAGEEAQKAKRLAAEELATKSKEVVELQAALASGNEKLAEAQKAQAELMRKERALEDAKREMDLTIEKQVQASLGDVRAKAKLEAEEALKLRVSEKDQIIASMQNKIEELKRKAEQGSQQLQGEVLELELENLLRARFPLDGIEPVPKGEFGGDLVQRVVGPSGLACGSILWEMKRTKNWTQGWIAKLREDQRRAKADVAIIISTALPTGVSTFDFVDGVWVADFKCAIPLTIVLRQLLSDVATARVIGEGQQSKMELVYDYLTGPRFRQRVEAIVEKFDEMQSDLDKERKAMTKLWAKRQTQIDGVLAATAGMYGDLQGIAGQALKEIEGFELPLLEGGKEDEDESEAA